MKPPFTVSKTVSIRLHVLSGAWFSIMDAEDTNVCRVHFGVEDHRQAAQAKAEEIARLLNLGAKANRRLKQAVESINKAKGDRPQ